MTQYKTLMYQETKILKYTSPKRTMFCMLLLIFEKHLYFYELKSHIWQNIVHMHSIYIIPKDIVIANQAKRITIKIYIGVSS